MIDNSLHSGGNAGVNVWEGGLGTNRQNFRCVGDHHIDGRSNNADCRGIDARYSGHA